MEKGSVGRNADPTSPLPSAPPLYEEAVALRAPDASDQPINTPPYPTGTATMPMPMPMPMPMSTSTPMPMPMPMPMPTSTSTSTPMPTAMSYNQPVNQTTVPVPSPQVRIVHHITYMLGPNPVVIICPSCHYEIKTTIISDHQRSAHICCIVLCIIGCYLCSCLPYCMNAFKSVHHFCPNCKCYIGTWK